jgi:hypothetical protein
MDSTDSRPAPSPETQSDDFASPFNSADAAVAEQAAACDPLPWECDPPEESGRQRHDAFTGAKKQQYLKLLARVGCILDACRLTGVSSSTVYNHQAGDPDFARNCGLAIAMAATPIELAAYERAVVGQEEPVIRGGKVVGTRIKRSDYMLRVLLQGADPKKYGPRPGFARKRILKAERKQIEREVRAEMAEPRTSFEEAIAELDKALDHFGERTFARRREEGWTDLGGGVWVPPGWAWAGEGDPSEAVARLEKKDDAVCNSSNSSISEPPPAPREREGEPFPEEAKSQEPSDLPSFRRRPESMNTDVPEPRSPCSWIPDQVRDDEGYPARPATILHLATSKPLSSGILADEPPGEPT